MIQILFSSTNIYICIYIYIYVDTSPDHFNPLAVYVRVINIICLNLIASTHTSVHELELHICVKYLDSTQFL